MRYDVTSVVYTRACFNNFGTEQLNYSATRQSTNSAGMRHPSITSVSYTHLIKEDSKKQKEELNQKFDKINEENNENFKKQEEKFNKIEENFRKQEET